MTDSNVSNLSSSNPEIGSRIRDLTDQTFERMGAHLSQYSRDERRVGSISGLLYLSRQKGWQPETYFSSENNTGNLAIEIGRTASIPAVQELLEGSNDFMATVTGEDPDVSHGYLVHESTRQSLGLPESPYTKISPTGVIVEVLRQKYSKGRIYGALGFASEDYDPTIQGERHKIGIKIVALFRNSRDLDNPKVWELGTYLQNRFDRSPAQKKVISRFNGTPEGPGTDKGPLGEELSTTSDVTIADIELMEGVLKAIKDPRLVTTPIKSYEKQIQAEEQEREDFREWYRSLAAA